MLITSLQAADLVGSFVSGLIFTFAIESQNADRVGPFIFVIMQNCLLDNE
jgi:hypothetical protein